MKGRFFRVLSIVSIVAMLLSGCEFLDKIRSAILDQADKTVQSVNEKVGAAGEQFEKTAASVKQKVDDVTTAAREVQEAANEISEAVEAVKKVGTTPSPAASVSPNPSVSPSPGVSPSPTSSKSGAPSLKDTN